MFIKWWPWKRRVVSFGLTEQDAMLIATLVRKIVTEVVQTELEGLTTAAVETLKPLADAIIESDRSARLIIDGQALVEKAVANMTEALKARGSDDGEWWNGGSTDAG